MLFNLLTTKDCKTIENWIAQYGPSNNEEAFQNEAAPLEFRLRHWESNKEEHLSRLFGGKLILEKPVAFDVPIAQIQRKMSRALNDDTSAIGIFYQKVLSNAYFQPYEDYLKICYLFDSRYLSVNRIEYLSPRSYPKGISFELNDVKIQYGINSKPIKILGKVAKALNLLEEYEAFRLEHSRLLNQKSLTGSLCLSIHPMDYMTMSDNASNWTSCMSWRENGCYRVGTVEMMNSPYVIVAYLKSNSTQLTFPGGEWNDKHWRTLIIVHPNAIVNVKNYPYFNDTLTKECLEWIRQLAFTNLGWNFYNEPDEIWDDEYKTIPFLNRRVCLTMLTDQMYNDFGDGNHWTLFNPPDDSTEDWRTVINYSGPASCMWCGDSLYTTSDESEQFVVCDDCIDHTVYEVCDYCGATITEHEAMWVDGCPYCYHCYEEHSAYCEILSDRFPFTSLERIYCVKNGETVTWDHPSCFIHNSFTSGYRDITDLWYSRFEFYCAPRFNDILGVYYFYEDDMSEYTRTHLFDI